jgi:hypothetical protein
MDEAVAADAVELAGVVVGAEAVAVAAAIPMGAAVAVLTTTRDRQAARRKRTRPPCHHRAAVTCLFAYLFRKFV